MDLVTLSTLNAERASRRATILVTDVANGAQRLVKAAEIPGDPLAEALTWAAEIARRDPVALRKAKERIDADERDSGLLGERIVEAGLYLRRRT